MRSHDTGKVFVCMCTRARREKRGGRSIATCVLVSVAQIVAWNVFGLSIKPHSRLDECCTLPAADQMMEPKGPACTPTHLDTIMCGMYI